MPEESPPDDRRSALRVAGALLLIVALAAAIRFARLGADLPLEAETTNAPALDAFWYLEAASARADGVALEPTPTYDLEPWVSVAKVWFALFGAGFESACALGAAVGVATVLIVFFFARPLGARTALAAALLAAVAFPFAQQGRSPLIYGFVALVLAAIAWLGTRGTRATRAAAWALALAAPVLLKAPAAALLGGLALAQVARSRRPLVACLALAAAGAAALLALRTLDVLGFWSLTRERLANYVGVIDAPALGERSLRLGARPGANALDAAANGEGVLALSPAPLLLAVLGVAFAWRDLRAREGAPRDALAIALGWSVAFLLAAVPFAYRPIRYFVPVFPAALVLAAHALVRLSAPVPEKAPEPRAWRLATIVLAAPFGALLAAHLADLAAGLILLPLPLVVLAAAAFIGAAVATLGIVLGLAPSRRARRLLAIVLGVLVTVDALRDLRAAAKPVWTTVRARASIAAVLPAGAVLAGPYATVLATGTRTERRLGANLGLAPSASAEDLARVLRGRGYTHFAIDVEQAFRFGIVARLSAIGQAPLLVAVVYMRCEPVFLYRFAWASELGCAPSRFEAARLLEERSGAAVAIPAFEAAGANGDPDLVLAHVRALVHEGAWLDAPIAARAGLLHAPGAADLALLVSDVDKLLPPTSLPESAPASSASR